MNNTPREWAMKAALVAGLLVPALAHADDNALLERALAGPRRAKRELLREVRDHLTDSVESYGDAGLDEAAARGWTVVDMKRDWNRVFPAN